MIVLDILVFVITTGLLIATAGRLAMPFSWLVSGMIIIALLMVNVELVGLNRFSLGQFIWSLLVVGGLNGYRLRFRHHSA